MEVIPKDGQRSFIAGRGDSGSPIFAWNTAFGILTHSSATQGNLTPTDDATGTSQVVWYTPMDDVNRQNYSLLY